MKGTEQQKDNARRTRHDKPTNDRSGENRSLSRQGVQRYQWYDHLALGPRRGAWHRGVVGREVAGALSGGGLQQRAAGVTGEPLQYPLRDSAVEVPPTVGSATDRGSQELTR